MNSTSIKMRVFGIATAVVMIGAASVITAHALTNNVSEPILHIDFHEGSGLLAADVSGHGNDGTRHNGVGWGIGNFGGAAAFKYGASQYVSVDSTDALQDASNGFSVCAWSNINQFNSNVPEDESIIVAKPVTDFGSTSTDPWIQWALFVKNDAGNDATYPAFGIGDASKPGSTVYSYSGTKIPQNAWVHICGTYDGSTMNTYLNGNLIATKPASLSTFGHTDMPVLIGAFGSTDYPDFWSGMIDDVRIYNYALSAADILKLFAPSAPTITLNGDAHATTTVGGTFTDPGAIASDDVDGVLAVATSTDPSPINFSAPGTFTITYSATNSFALGASVSRILDILPAVVSTTTSTTTTPVVGNGDDDGVIIPPTTGTTTTSTTTTTVANGDDDGIIIPPSNNQNTSSTTATTTTTIANGDDDAPTLPPATPVVEQARWVSVSSGGTSGGGSFLPPSSPTVTIASNAGAGSGTTGNTNTGTVPAQGQVLGAESSCSKYLFNPLKYGDDRNDVTKLQAFLNEVLGANLPLNGVFGPATKAAVDQFQLKYKTDILDPWMHEGFNLSGKPTGYVGPTTLRMINNLVCPDLQLPMPELH